MDIYLHSLRCPGDPGRRRLQVLQAASEGEGWKVSELSFLALRSGWVCLASFEPCSLGANGIFLSYLRKKDRNDRLLETAKFALSRSAVLGLFGIGVSFLDSFVFSAQKGFRLFLGLLYLVLGVAVIWTPASAGPLRPHLFSPAAPRTQGLLFGVGTLVWHRPPCVRLPATPGPPRRERRLRKSLGLRYALRLQLALSLPLIPLALSERTARSSDASRV